MVVARRPAPRSRIQSIQPPHRSACPVCKRSDRAEKASSVVAQNSGTVWGDNGTTYQYRNELAMQLACPSRPEAPGWPKAAKALGASLALTGILLAAHQLIGTATDVSYPAQLAFMLAIGLFGALIPLRVLAGTYWQRRLMSQRMPLWNESASRWRRVYYCFRDDVIYVQGSAAYFSPRDLEKLLLAERPASAQKLVLRQAPLES